MFFYRVVTEKLNKYLRSLFPAFSLRVQGDTVDIHRTMSKVAENILFYKIAAQPRFPPKR